MAKFKDAAALLPINLSNAIFEQPADVQERCEEIRLRTGTPLRLLYEGSEHDILSNYKINSEDIESILEKATEASFHSVEESVSNGYLYAKGGIRIGLCGTGFIKDNGLNGLRDFSSLAIRIPHEIRNCGTDMLFTVMKEGPSDIMIISPPGAGKTSCLREYVRLISNEGYRISLIDERGELSGIVNGQAQLDVGCHTDILFNLSKKEASIMMLRSMNPQFIAMDEISSNKDIEAVQDISGCGVKILATAHAAGVNDLNKRPVYAELMRKQIFRYAIIINNTCGNRTYALEKLC